MSKTQINEFYSFKKFAPTPENPELISTGRKLLSANWRR